MSSGSAGSSRSLEMPRRPEPARRSKLWWVLSVVLIVALAAGWLVWYLRTPDGLPTSSRTAEGAGVVDQDLYVGMFAVGDGFGRTIHISDVSVEADSDAEVTVEPKICVEGTISVTTDAESFCSELTDVDGADFGPGDSIVLVVHTPEPATVDIGQLQVSYREGIRWGTKDAGLAGATLTFAEGTPGTVEDDTGSDGTTGERPGHDETDKKDKKKGDDKKGSRNKNGGNAAG